MKQRLLWLSLAAATTATIYWFSKQKKQQVPSSPEQRPVKESLRVLAGNYANGLARG